MIKSNNTARIIRRKERVDSYRTRGRAECG